MRACFDFLRQKTGVGGTPPFRPLPMLRPCLVIIIFVVNNLQFLSFIPCADVNAKDTFGKTPLHNAILGKHVTIVELLLKSGADVKCLDERGDTPLHNAVRVDSEAIVVVSF